MAETMKATSTKKQETKAKIITAIAESNGFLTVVAKRTGLHYTTVCEYVREHPDVKQAITEAKEKMLDFAESKLVEKIKAGDNTMIIFYLKTQGKARGYIERSEITGKEGESLIPQIVVQSAKGKKLTEKVIQGERT